MQAAFAFITRLQACDGNWMYFIMRYVFPAKDRHLMQISLRTSFAGTQVRLLASQVYQVCDIQVEIRRAESRLCGTQETPKVGILSRLSRDHYACMLVVATSLAIQPRADLLVSQVHYVT